MHMRHSDAIGCLVHPMRAWDQVVSLFLRSGLDLARMAISSMLLRFCKSMHMILKGDEENGFKGIVS